MQSLVVNEHHQPRGLYVLFFLELWERFSYWGTQSILVLYLIRYFLFSDAKSYTLFGAYTALTYATALLGGVMADRFLGFKRCLVLGALLIILGNIVLALPDKMCLYLGLSLVIAGTGLIKPNGASQLGTLYTKNDSRRDSGFTIFYVGINVGGILGPIVYGFVATRYGWHAAFITSAVGVLVGLAVYVLHDAAFKKSVLQKSLARQLVLLSYPLLVGLFCLLLLHPKWVAHLLNGLGFVTLTGFLFFAYRANSKERRSIIIIFLMVCFCVLFFACLFQCSTSLILFIERFADRRILDWVIPTASFVSLQPLFVVLLAPLLAQVWTRLKTHEPNAPKKIVLGLLCTSLSFACFMLATLDASNTHKAGLFWIITGNVWLSLGELCIAPPILAAITQLAPVTLQATLIGSFYLSLAFAGYLASLIAKLTTAIAIDAHASVHYFTAYQAIFYLALALSAIAYVISYYGHNTYQVLTQDN